VSHARLWLHVAALLAPLAAAAAWSFLLNPDDARLALRQTCLFGGLAAVAAQIAALSCWRALDRRARAGSGAWKVGIGMAAITHLLFGALFALGMNVSLWLLRSADASSIGDAAVQALFFVAVSALSVGFVSFPLTAALAHGLAGLRARELGDAASLPLPGGERGKGGGVSPSGNCDSPASPPLPSGERVGVRGHQ